jgi:DNA-binding MarR family transcriptional regulator
MYRAAMSGDVESPTDSLLASARALVAMAIATVDEGPMPVTVVQHRVLLLLEEAGALSVNDVADRLGVNQSNASRHCSRLAEIGLVSRGTVDHDRRSVRLQLTAAGRRQVLAVRDARRRWADAVLARLSAEQATDVVRALTVFAEAAHAVEPAAPATLL